MPLITWNKTFETGIKAIDEQHKRWIEYINELHQAMMTGQGRVIVVKTLENVVEYSNTHFKAEEQLMRDAGYPPAEYDRHCAEHEKFIAQVRGLKDELMISNSFAIAIDTFDFLRSWLTNHIKFTDMKYVPYLKGKKG